MNIKPYISAGTICLSIILLCSPGFAQDPWKFDLGASFWTAGLKGDLAVKSIETEADAGLGDVVSSLDMTFQFYAEATRGKWGSFLDTSYLNLSKDAEVGPAGIDAEVKNWVVDVAGSYRLYEKALSDSGKQLLSIEALLGGRYLSPEISLDVGNSVNISEKSHWLDLLLGGRMRADLTEKVDVTLRADIGGFGVGLGDSGSTTGVSSWSVTSSLRYRFTPRFSLWGAYRALGVSYESGSDNEKFQFDTTMSGPLFGLGVNF